MKISPFIALFFTLIGFGQTPQKSQIVSDDLAKISENRIEQDLNFLASDSLHGRLLGTSGIEKAAQFIEGQFRKMRVKPYYKTYRDTFKYKGETGYNIIAYKEGIDPQLKKEILLIGAHYDHIGIQAPVNGDSIANGANDDASGTVAVLEMARYFSQHPTKRSLLFVLFSGEEEGLIGSRHLAKRLQSESAPLYAMLEFEMIGVPLQGKDFQAYLTGYHKSNFAKRFNKGAQSKLLGFLPIAQHYQLFKRSDNYPFYSTFNIPAHCLSTFEFTNFDYYHKVGDEVWRLDIPFMTRLILNCIPGIKAVSNALKDDIKLISN